MMFVMDGVTVTASEDDVITALDDWSAIRHWLIQGWVSFANGIDRGAKTRVYSVTEYGYAKAEKDAAAWKALIESHIER